MHTHQVVVKPADQECCPVCLARVPTRPPNNGKLRPSSSDSRTARTLASRSPVAAPSSTLCRMKWLAPTSVSQARVQPPRTAVSNLWLSPAHYSPRHRRHWRARHTCPWRWRQAVFPPPRPTHAVDVYPSSEFPAAPPRPGGVSALLGRSHQRPRLGARLASSRIILLPEAISRKRTKSFAETGSRTRGGPRGCDSLCSLHGTGPPDRTAAYAYR